MTTIENVKALAQRFLDLADAKCIQVSRYLNGSDDADDVAAYDEVRAADRALIDAVEDYEGERYEYGLNYDLAESYL